MWRSSPARVMGGLRSLAVAYACGLWLLLTLLLELYGHKSKALGVLTVLPAGALSWWGSRREGAPRWLGAARVVGLVGLFVLTMVLFTVDPKREERGSWGLWVPAMTLDFTPSMLVALPGVALACAALTVAVHGAVFAWRGRGSYLVAYAGPAIWMFLAFGGFYRGTFDRFDPPAVAAQPGVRLLAPSGARPCGLFETRCSDRLFPRGVGVDEKTRTLFATFGATAREVSLGLPKLLSVRLDDGAATWMEGTASYNEIRNVFVDEGARRVLVGQWGSNCVGVYDADTLKLDRSLPYPVAADEEYQPISVLVDGDRVLVVNIWFPRIVEISLSRGTATRVVDLYELGIVGTGVQLAGGALSRRRNRLWVTLAQPGDTVLELDLTTLEPLRRVELRAMFPASISYDDEAGRLYVTGFRSSAVEVVDVAGMRKVDELPGAIGARETAIDPQRGLLFVMDYLRGRVLFVSLRERRIVREVAVGPKPGGAVVSGGRLYVSGTLGVVEIALDEGEPAVGRTRRSGETSRSTP